MVQHYCHWVGVWNFWKFISDLCFPLNFGLGISVGGEYCSTTSVYVKIFSAKHPAGVASCKRWVFEENQSHLSRSQRLECDQQTTQDVIMYIQNTWFGQISGSICRLHFHSCCVCQGCSFIRSWCRLHWQILPRPRWQYNTRSERWLCRDEPILAFTALRKIHDSWRFKLHYIISWT